VRFHGQDLTVDTKATDTVFGTELERCQQRLGVGHTQTRKLGQCRITIHAADGLDRCVAKLDRLFTKDAAEAKADFCSGWTLRHCYQLLQVIDNCSTVAIETHTKYGTCDTATHLRCFQMTKDIQIIVTQTIIMSNAASGKFRSPN